MYWTVPPSIIRSFSLYTQQWYMKYRFADSLRALLCVQWKTPDDRQRNRPIHVEFYSKNKSEKLVHLVGFIISIYHNAWSLECQILYMYHFLFTNMCIFMKKTENVKFHTGHKLQWWHLRKYKFLPTNFSTEHKAHDIVNIHEKCQTSIKESLSY